MINWDKPIETVDGRRAKVLTCVAAGEKNARAVYVTPKENFCFGDVFIVNDDGCRRDERASYTDWQEPFIRNVQVKRKSWIRLPIHDYYKADTKEECEASFTSPNFKAVYCEWEE